MKKHILLGIIALAFATNANAAYQFKGFGPKKWDTFGKSSSATIDAQAKVIASLSVSAIDSLAMGEYIQGNSGTILKTDPEAGHFGVKGEINRAVNSSISDTDLTHETDNLATMALTTSADLPSNLGATGDITVAVGGSASAAVDQKPGLYNGSVTLSVSYQ